MHYKTILLITSIFATSLAASSQEAVAKSNTSEKLEIAKQGLILDLDATAGVKRNAANKVLSWENQVADFPAKRFVPNPIGRKKPKQGIPRYLSKEKSTGNYPTIQFKRQELINFDEDAFDALIQGKGHTWVCILAVEDQTAAKRNVNAFFGNLRNTNAFEKSGTGGFYEGFWGVLHHNRKVFAGTRNGIDMLRDGVNNPELLSKTVLEKKRLHLVAGRMGAGTGTVPLEVFVNDFNPENKTTTPVNPKANPSKMAIGQERDATNHPGAESFNGEIARLLIYDRPLSDDELKTLVTELMKKYEVNK